MGKDIIDMVERNITGPQIRAAALPFITAMRAKNRDIKTPE